ncbi:MAG TPA: 50S ribosomal protein L10, partial [Patescibacteria group bacterium]|nr:50S ribosomal protein L10 [Patescibacteria group bacterium]
LPAGRQEIFDFRICNIMPKSKEQKKEILENLKQKIGDSKSVVFTNFEGLGVKENEELRNRLKQEGGEYYVPKKTLLKMALEENNISSVNPRDIDGKLAVVFGYEDEVVPAKILDEFKEKYEGKIEFAGGILENQFLSPEKVGELAKLPSKEELYAKLVGSLAAPMSGLVNTMAGNMRNLVYALKAIEDQKSQ